jgi:amidase
MALPLWIEGTESKRKQRSEKVPQKRRIPLELMPSEHTRDVQDLPHSSGFFTSDELMITESTASDVVQRIASGEQKARDVMEAICRRASVAQQLINCITDICFEEALKRAEELDSYFEQEGKTIGPLHGLPISFKDQLNLIGLDTSVGYVSWCNKPASEESTLVTLLCKAGAVPYVKTKVPAKLTRREMVNNVFGRTLNPRNRELTTGGSPGGESALITFRGSFLRIGTDIGGSIRHPCSFTGLYGLRPSHGRENHTRAWDGVQ